MKTTTIQPLWVTNPSQQKVPSSSISNSYYLPSEVYSYSVLTVSIAAKFNSTKHNITSRNRPQLLLLMSNPLSSCDAWTGSSCPFAHSQGHHFHPGTAQFCSANKHIRQLRWRHTAGCHSTLKEGGTSYKRNRNKWGWLQTPPTPSVIDLDFSSINVFCWWWLFFFKQTKSSVYSTMLRCFGREHFS